MLLLFLIQKVYHIASRMADAEMNEERALFQKLALYILETENRHWQTIV